MQSHVELKPEVREQVMELARVNRDSVDGLKKVAEAVENPGLQRVFMATAIERQQFARELEPHLDAEQLEQAREGTLKAKLHRWWIDVRDKVSSSDEYALLAEAERGEDQIKAAYEEVILGTVGNPISDVLHRQLRKVKQDHDRIRDLRDAAKAGGQTASTEL